MKLKTLAKIGIACYLAYQLSDACSSTLYEKSDLEKKIELYLR